jgi:hypothetical protein
LAAAWLLACGCDVVFRIDELPAPDGPPSCGATTSHDEDGDGVPDGCDVCPGIPDPAQMDADNDGVGDACDPDPSSAQHLALFESFAEAGAADAWSVQTGTWMFAPDAVVFSSTQTGYSVLTAKSHPAPPDVIEVGVTIDNLLAGQGGLFMVFGDTPVPCGVLHYVASPDVVRVEDESSTVNMETDLGAPLHAGQRLRITDAYTPGASVHCTVTDRDTQASAVAHVMLDAIPPDRLGFKATTIAVHVEYVAVYAP